MPGTPRKPSSEFKQLAPGEPPLHVRRPDGSVRFAKGHRVHGGAKKGQKRVTGETKDLIRAFVRENWADAQAIYERVKRRSPGMAIDLLVKATEYVEPKLARQENTGAGGGPVVVELVTLSGAPPNPPKQEATVEPSPDGE